MRPILTREQQLVIAVWLAMCSAVLLLALALAGKLSGAEPAPPSSLIPRPSAEQLARAEKDARDIFARDIEAARKPADKKALAAKMLAAARKVNDDPAGRYVLAVQARDLAIAGGDSAAAVQAVELLAGYSPSNDDAKKAKDAAARAGLAWYSAKGLAAGGHEAWNQGEKLRGQEQLAKRIEAAESYLRAIGGLEGLERKLAEKRLGELGWRAGALSPEEVIRLFGLVGWRVDGETLSGRVENYGASRAVLKDPIKAQRIDFRVSMKSPWFHFIQAEVDGRMCAYLRGGWENRGSSTIDQFNKVDRKELPGPVVKSPERFHELRLTVGDGRLRILYDGDETYTASIPPPPPGGYSIRLGFSSERTDLTVRDVFLDH